MTEPIQEQDVYRVTFESAVHKTTQTIDVYSGHRLDLWGNRPVVLIPDPEGWPPMWAGLGQATTGDTA